jgi:hypothetical protein
VSIADSNLTTAPSETHERKIILLLCLLAAVHVFIFSATFPFFNNVDEQVHLDLVVRYSHLEIPRAIDTPCAEVLPFISVYGTIEYLWPPESQPGKRIPPPPWTLPINVIAQNLVDKEAIWKAVVKNHEASQPPLYYSLAGLWWHLGKLLGFDGGHLLYWLRFLNILAVIALVWLGHLAARLIFPENCFVRLGVPALIALIPQTAFYSIQNDVLSPVCFGAAFVCLIKLWRAEVPDARLGIFAGITLAATFLTKISNLPLLAVSAAVVLFKSWQLAKAGKFRAASPALAALALCAGLPMGAWLAWCKHAFGDFSGTAAKIQFLGWTHKAFAEWWHHPIFTPHGLWTFLSGLIATFWQGEILWDRKPLALPSADMIYVLSSIIFVGIALLNLLPHSKNATMAQRRALWFGFFCFAAAVTFLGFLSTIYDFHDCFYPSREHPYFTSGRLMLGALIPFLLLFVYGLDRALKKFSNAAKFSALTGLVLFMLVTEITIDWPIFPNPYNWFHM